MRKEGKYDPFAGGVPASLPSTAMQSPAAAASNNHHASLKAEAARPNEAEAKQKRLNPIKLKQMKERLQEVEEEIARFEAAIGAAEAALQTFVSVEETQNQTNLLNRAKADLEKTMNEWEELAQVLETAE